MVAVVAVPMAPSATIIVIMVMHYTRAKGEASKHEEG
jgi:hypothetical protein